MRCLQTIFGATLLCLAGVAGCTEAPESTTQTPDTAAVDPETMLTAVNTHCPIMGGKVTDEGGQTMWDGKTVGFCCPSCIEDWNKLSDEEKETKLAAAGQGDAEHDHEEPGSGEASSGDSEKAAG